MYRYIQMLTNTDPKQGPWWVGPWPPDTALPKAKLANLNFQLMTS